MKKQEKKKYTPPQLFKYGDFKKLTGGTRRSGREDSITSTLKTRASTSSG